MKPEQGTQFDPRSERSTEDSSFVLLRNNIFEVFRILILRRWAFFVPFCLVVCVATIISQYIPRIYKSTTVIERRDHPVLINLRQTVATGEFARFFRPTLSRDVKSTEAMSEAVAKANLIPDLPRKPDGTPTEEGWEMCRRKGSELASGVNVRLIQRTEHLDQIQITFEGQSPTMPQQFVRAIKDAYVRRMREQLVTMLDDAKSYFENTARDQRQQISDLESETLAFQAEFIGIDPTNPGALKLKLTSLDSERAELERDLNMLTLESEARRRRIEQHKMRTRQSLAMQLGSAIPSKRNLSPEAQTMEAEILGMQREIHDLKTTRRMTDRHPDIIELRKRINSVKGHLESQYAASASGGTAGEHIAAGGSPAIWDMELADLQLDLQDRENRIAAMQQRLRVIESDITKHKRLEDNIFRYRKDFQVKQDLLDQARAEHTMNSRRVVEIAGILNADESERGVSFTELTPPTACIKPVSPRSTTVLALSILAGLGAGAVGVLRKELFDQTYHTTKQVTRSLGLAVLESVEEFITSVERARLFRRRVIYAPALVFVLLTAVGFSCAAAFLSIEKPKAYEHYMTKPRAIWQSVWNEKSVADSTKVSNSKKPTQTKIEKAPADSKPPRVGPKLVKKKDTALASIEAGK
ncbi:MAG: hypothetical protein DHS20C16_11360 [Phycisphaerae bacterium]|nr:MAG: hypothetical protein DHS20C16_11360 [Phycisphaerae bacterium]